MSETPIRVERQGVVAVVTINRPQRKNSLSRETLLALGHAGKELTADNSLRAIIITGGGDQVFCAGADLKERAGMSEAEVEEQLDLYSTQLGWLDQAPLPVIAAINGAALGGGLELALMCDLRLATDNAVLGLPETSLGIIPGAGGTQRLPRIVGEARAKQMVLMNERLPAMEAFRIGLLHRVTPNGSPLLADALAWLEPILSGAPIAQRAALEAIDAARDLPIEDGLRFERELYRRCLYSEDRKEALRAFADKRPPRFSGR